MCFFGVCFFGVCFCSVVHLYFLRGFALLWPRYLLPAPEVRLPGLSASGGVRSTFTQVSVTVSLRGHSRTEMRDAGSLSMMPLLNVYDVVTAFSGAIFGLWMSLMVL